MGRVVLGGETRVRVRGFIGISISMARLTPDEDGRDFCKAAVNVADTAAWTATIGPSP